jgi:hypothetical protein
MTERDTTETPGTVPGETQIAPRLSQAEKQWRRYMTEQLMLSRSFWVGRPPLACSFDRACDWDDFALASAASRLMMAARRGPKAPKQDDNPQNVAGL